MAAGRAALRSPLAAEVWVVLSTPSFIVVVVQGFLGSMPWSAFAFTTLFLQLQGWSDFAASAAMAAFSAADALGALLGGAVGDWAAKRFPDHGRITACQFSVGIGVPMFALIFQGLPLGSGGWVVGCYVGLLAVTGVLISWAATACNNPIFAEIVPPHLRTLVYAFDRCLEGVLSALGAPMVGVAAQRLFGFSGAAASAAGCSSLSSHTSRRHQPDLHKARALGDALTLFTTVPWTLCVLVYSFLHCTYPRDKRRSSCTGDPVVLAEQLPSAEHAAFALVPSHAPAAAAAAVVSEVELHDWEAAGDDDHSTLLRSTMTAPLR
ncbi:hypothetical protein OEZ86_009949 [Tetradesmus obliquus]|nr:hypothetical protein OEZ86_009949 [Tetradesmus obliquus]